MNTVEASILLEEAIDLAAASPDDAIYARLLAFRDGWFRNRRISAPIRSLSRGPAGKVGTYTLGPLVVNGVAYPGPISVDWTEP